MRKVLLCAMSVVLALSAGCASSRLDELPGIKELTRLSGLRASDEERIAAVLNDVHRGMEARRIYKVLAHVSRNYHDAEGRDYEAMEAYLKEAFKNYREIRITRVVPRIVVKGNRARAIETFGTVAEPADPASDPPINLQGQVSVSLEKADGRWQIVEWGRML